MMIEIFMQTLLILMKGNLSYTLITMILKSLHKYLNHHNRQNMLDVYKITFVAV